MTHCSVPSAFSVHTVSPKASVFFRPRKSGVSYDRMTAVPTHGSMSSFLEAL